MAANELFPKRLRALRERRQIKRRVLAELCGLSQHMIRRYEEGEMEPKASSLEVTIKSVFRCLARSQMRRMMKHSEAKDQ